MKNQFVPVRSPGIVVPGFSPLYRRTMPCVLLRHFNIIDHAIASWMERHGLLLLRISLALVFIWFGALKPFRISPADDLIQRTVYWFDPDVFIPILGAWEVLIGACLLMRPLIRVAILLLFLQMPGTFLPLVLLPDVCFTHVPWAPTLEGQYIIKNLVLISAAIVVGGTVRRNSTSQKHM